MENTLEEKTKFFSGFMLPGQQFQLVKECYYDESLPTESMGHGVKKIGFIFRYDFVVTPNAFRYGSGIFPVKFISKSAIVMKRLSEITEQHCKEICAIVYSWDEDVLDPEDVPEWIDDILSEDGDASGCEVLIIVDYLRSKGYAVLYKGISVKQQLKWKWIIFE